MELDSIRHELVSIEIDLSLLKVQRGQGRIRRELPSEFYGSTVGEVMAQAGSGSTSAKKCLKLLKQDRFRK